MERRHASLLPLLSILCACGDDGAAGGTDTTGAGSSEAASGEASSASASGEGTGESTGTGGETEADCFELPELVDADLEVGPGCVRMGQTDVEDATLTFAPGTTVEVAAGGYLAAAAFGGNGAIVAIGTEPEPIVFTSAAAEPLAGDWQCVHLGSGASASDLDFVVIEHAGSPCAATGADYDGALFVDAPVRRITNTTVRNSSGYGLWLDDDGDVRELHDNTFADNEEASIRVSARSLSGIGTPNVFSDADDFIEIDGTFSYDHNGTWTRQDVPYRIEGGMSITDNAEVTIEAGTVIELAGGTLEVFIAALTAIGTEAEPIVFRSGVADPQAGDWGCIWFTSITVDPTFENVVVQHAGNGDGCSGANYRAAIVGPTTMNISATTFSDIDGFAIRVDDCDGAEDLCANTFEASITDEPLVCGFDEMAVACP